MGDAGLLLWQSVLREKKEVAPVNLAGKKGLITLIIKGVMSQIEGVDYGSRVL